jgi:DNA-binding NarL/FixJ family response regulator
VCVPRTSTPPALGAAIPRQAGDRGGDWHGRDARPLRVDLMADDRRLLALLAEGMVLDAVARHLNLSPRTLRRRVRALCDRIGVDNWVQAVVWAARIGIV